MKIAGGFGLPIVIKEATKEKHRFNVGYVLLETYSPSWIIEKTVLKSNDNEFSIRITEVGGCLALYLGSHSFHPINEPSEVESDSDSDASVSSESSRSLVGLITHTTNKGQFDNFDSGNVHLLGLSGGVWHRGISCGKSLTIFEGGLHHQEKAERFLWE